MCAVRRCDYPPPSRLRLCVHPPYVLTYSRHHLIPAPLDPAPHPHGQQPYPEFEPPIHVSTATHFTPKARSAGMWACAQPAVQACSVHRPRLARADDDKWITQMGRTLTTVAARVFSNDLRASHGGHRDRCVRSDVVGERHNGEHGNGKWEGGGCFVHRTYLLYTYQTTWVAQLRTDRITAFYSPYAPSHQPTRPA